MLCFFKKNRISTFRSWENLSRLENVFNLRHQNHATKFIKHDIVLPWNVSKMNTVPQHISKPVYFETSVPPTPRTEPEIKNNNQIEYMRQTCILAKKILQETENLIKPGVTTDFLDKYIHESIIKNGAYPSPLNYKGFPKSVCTSVNNVAAHGIPDDRPLLDGDIINVDITVYLNGYHGDCSKTFQVGNVDSAGKKLIEINKLCMENTIKLCKPGENFCSIGKIIEKTAKQNGFNVVPSLIGHGIGDYFHGPPDIYHFDNDYPGKMEPGMTFTIEPVLTEGEPDVEILNDGWTIVTTDDARTVQIEHTVLITDIGCDVLT